MSRANPHRGEASLQVAGETLVLRPSFSALVAAEEELGPLFGLVERASEGKLALHEIAALFDHLSAGRPAAITRERIGDAVVEKGLAGISPTPASRCRAGRRGARAEAPDDPPTDAGTDRDSNVSNDSIEPPRGWMRAHRAPEK